MLKNKKTKNFIFFILIGVLFIFLVIYSTHQYTYSKNEISKTEFIGTYELESSGHEYITLLAENDEQNNNFYYFNDNGEIISNGNYEYFDENFVIIKNQKDEIISTIICKEMDFVLVNNESDMVYSLLKYSNEPIVFEW